MWKIEKLNLIGYLDALQQNGGNGISGVMANGLISKFNEGQVVVRNGDGLPALHSLSIRLGGSDLDKLASYPFYEEGVFGHRDDGDTLMEVAMLHSTHGTKYLERQLRKAQMEICQSLNLRCLMVVAELAAYQPFSKSMSVHQYLGRVINKELFDPLLSYSLSGFNLIRLLTPKPTGNENRHFALMEWSNIHYNPAVTFAPPLNHPSA